MELVFHFLGELLGRIVFVLVGGFFAWLFEQPKAIRLLVLLAGLAVPAAAALGLWWLLAGPVPPDVPRNVAAAPNDGCVRVTYDAPESGPVTGYEVQYKEASASPWRDNGQTRESSVIITGLENGTRYEVRVRAVYRSGPGDWSAAVKAKPNFELPSLTVWAWGQPAEGEVDVELIISLRRMRLFQDTTIPIWTGGTASYHDDWSLSADNFTIPADRKTDVVFLQVVDDRVKDPGETIIISLTDPGACITTDSAPGTRDQLPLKNGITLTIEDND